MASSLLPPLCLGCVAIRVSPYLALGVLRASRTTAGRGWLEVVAAPLDHLARVLGVLLHLAVPCLLQQLRPLGVLPMGQGPKLAIHLALFPASRELGVVAPVLYVPPGPPSELVAMGVLVNCPCKCRGLGVVWVMQVRPVPGPLQAARWNRAGKRALRFWAELVAPYFQWQSVSPAGAAARI